MDGQIICLFIQPSKLSSNLIIILGSKILSAKISLKSCTLINPFESSVLICQYVQMIRCESMTKISNQENKERVLQLVTDLDGVIFRASHIYIDGSNIIFPDNSDMSMCTVNLWQMVNLDPNPFNSQKWVLFHIVSYTYTCFAACKALCGSDVP